MTYLKRLILLVLPCLAIACAKTECVNNIYGLQVNDFNSTEYNIALLRWIHTSDSSSVNYVFDKLVEEDGNRALLVNVNIKDQCAQGRFQVNGAIAGMEDLLDKEGSGYRGAKLDGFSFLVEGANDPIVLVCKSVNQVLD